MISSIEIWADEPIDTKESLSRAASGEVELLTLRSGRRLILKKSSDSKRLECEANGLGELAKTTTVPVPTVLLQGPGFLLSEYIEPGAVYDGFFESFGRGFAALHRQTSESFGFYEDNFIGVSMQKNIPDTPKQQDSWLVFFWEKRLLYQYYLAEHNGFTEGALSDLFIKLEKKYPALLAGSEEPPTLLHGDLWSGNFISGKDGRAWVIDPAVYYGNREADLAMTELFGGFPSSFYAAYEEAYPLKAGYGRRKNLYKLYHILNHLNIFGRGYYRQAVSLLQALL